MSTKLLAFWIDDQDQTEESQNLSSDLLRIVWTHPTRFKSSLTTMKGSDLPDIFLVDLYLNQKPNSENVFFQDHGLTPGALIREKFPEHPIYLVTNQENKNGYADLSKWSQATESVFDRILTVKELQRYQKNEQSLYYDALDYKTIRADTPRGDVKALIDLLRVPDSCEKLISLTLPDNLRNGLTPDTDSEGEGNTISFSRWVRRQLMVVPGILSDSLRISTLLGVNEVGFEKIAEIFSKAKYSGVFNGTHKSLWWVNEVTQLLFSEPGAADVDSDEPWSISNKIFDIQAEQRSRCAVCSEPFPETVGMDLDNKKESPVHIRCSQPDISKQRYLYFDGFRSFRKN